MAVVRVGNALVGLTVAVIETPGTGDAADAFEIAVGTTENLAHVRRTAAGVPSTELLRFERAGTERTGTVGRQNATVVDAVDGLDAEAKLYTKTVATRQIAGKASSPGSP